MGDIIDPLFNKYKFSSSISDVFLFNAATNSIYARADYQVLNAGAFDNQRILVSIRGTNGRMSIYVEYIGNHSLVGSLARSFVRSSVRSLARSFARLTQLIR